MSETTRTEESKMANLPEQSTFDAGVYQIELQDPVVGGPGGISNLQGKALANRTRYLKDQADGIINTQLPLKAPLVSPVLTGAPTSPTPTAGDNSGRVATTAFVTNAVTQSLGNSVPVVDGVASAGTGIFASRWDHRHPTDNSRAPLDSPVLTGAPTSPTPLLTDRSNRLATTNFVQTALDSWRITPDQNTNQVAILGPLQIAWGHASGNLNANSVLDVAIPIAFPTALLFKSVSAGLSTSTGAPLHLTVSAFDRTKLTVRPWNVSGQMLPAGYNIQFDWFAIGF